MLIHKKNIKLNDAHLTKLFLTNQKNSFKAKVMGIHYFSTPNSA